MLGGSFRRTSWIWLLVGVLLTVTAVVFLIHELLYAVRGVRTQATVLEINEKAVGFQESYRQGTRVRVQRTLSYAFHDEAGVNHNGASAVGLVVHRPGDRIEIEYRSDRPEINRRVGSRLRETWLAPALILPIGLCFALTGVLGLRGPQPRTSA